MGTMSVRVWFLEKSFVMYASPVAWCSEKIVTVLSRVKMFFIKSRIQFDMERQVCVDTTGQNIRHPLADRRLRLAALPSVNRSHTNAYLFGNSGNSDVFRALFNH